MDKVYKQALILIMFLFAFNGFCNAQTYQFKYAVRADSTYLAATNVLSSDEWGKIMLSAARQALYSDQYLFGYQNKQYLYYQSVIEQTSDTPKQSVKVNKPNLFGSETVSLPFSLDFSDLFSDARFYVDVQSKFLCFYENDTLKYSKYFLLDTFIATEDYKTINGWKCRKWLPIAQDISNRVTVWVSNEVPREINRSILCKDFDGGVVAIEWDNGRYDVLESFTVCDYIFDESKLKKPKSKKLKVKIGALRSALNDNYRDNIRTKVEYKN